MFEVEGGVGILWILFHDPATEEDPNLKTKMVQAQKS